MDQKMFLSIMGDWRTRRFEGSEWSSAGISEQTSGFRISSKRCFTDAQLRYCRVKAAETDALAKWSEPAEAIGLAKPNNVHRFLNYCWP